MNDLKYIPRLIYFYDAKNILLKDSEEYKLLEVLNKIYKKITNKSMQSIFASKDKNKKLEAITLLSNILHNYITNYSGLYNLYKGHIFCINVVDITDDIVSGSFYFNNIDNIEISESFGSLQFNSLDCRAKRCADEFIRILYELLDNENYKYEIQKEVQKNEEVLDDYKK